MKLILAAALTVAVVVADVPSIRYLPPSPNRGYSQSAPTIAAARALDHSHHQVDHHNGDHQLGSNGFARSGLNNDHGAHAHGTHTDDAHEHSHDHAGHDHGVHDHAGHDHAGHDHDTQARFNSNEDQSYEQNGLARNAVEDGNSTDEHGFNPQNSYEDSENLTPSSGHDSEDNNFRANNGHHGNGNHANEQDGAHANARLNRFN